jgi:serine/threonine-protein phosphatase 4 regulatory subunit 1
MTSGANNVGQSEALAPLNDIPSLDESMGDQQLPPGTPYVGEGAMGGPDHMGEVNLVDEGDVLPNMDFQMDVTFDDEGLNTLERIFLLSKSEFPFHRAYVARVLGDLLAEVDPCESVEYVLPLLSGFSMDEDESVKEAFASELHRILWYFYSTCRLISEETEHMEEEIASMDIEPTTETLTITSNGMDIVDKPTPAEIADAPTVQMRASSLLSDPSTASSSTNPFQSSMEDESSTPASTVSEVPSSQGTMFSPGEYVNPFSDDMDPEKGWAKDVGPLVDRPALVVNFFTPLLGSLLLNQNPAIAESVRNGVVNIIGRLRHKIEPTLESWGSAATQKEADERRTFASQNGPHSHDLRPFDRESRHMVEAELLVGIVVGMGQLSTEMPEGLFAETLEDGQRILDDYANSQGSLGQAQVSGQADIFQEQLIHEATTGRATSMNLIGSICEFYEPDELIHCGFVDEVLRSGDGDVAVRSEGAVSLGCVAKIAPLEEVYRLVGSETLQ